MDKRLVKRVAIESVKDAGKVIMLNLNKVKGYTFKSKSDIVTNIDIKAEKLIINKIEKNFPDHSILSEEKGLIDKKSSFLWIVDPLDGTMNYFHTAAPAVTVILQ